MASDESPSVGSQRARTGRPPGPRRSRAERREELLDAAERAIRRIGPQAVMDQLAAEAGITKPILYSHFGDRAGLAQALAERASEEVIAAVNGALQSAAATRSPQEVARAGITAFCDFVERDPNVYRFLVQNTFGYTHPMSSRLLTEIASRISKLLGRALRDAGADSGAAEPWAFGMVGLAFAGAEWWMERRMMPKNDLVEYLTELLWSGLSGAGLGGLDTERGADIERDSNVTEFAPRDASPPTASRGGNA